MSAVPLKEALAALSFNKTGSLQVRFGGIGGQGAVLLGDVLGHAGALAGLRTAGSTVYGSRARGGATRADVILSREEIDFPHVVHPQVLVSLAQEPYTINRPFLRDPGVVLYDAYHLKEGQIEKQDTTLSVPATKDVLEEFGRGQPANFYMLGALVGLTAVVPMEPVEIAMSKRVKARFVDMNRKALRLGLEGVKKALDAR